MENNPADPEYLRIVIQITEESDGRSKFKESFYRTTYPDYPQSLTMWGVHCNLARTEPEPSDSVTPYISIEGKCTWVTQVAFVEFQPMSKVPGGVHPNVMTLTSKRGKMVAMGKSFLCQELAPESVPESAPDPGT